MRALREEEDEAENPLPFDMLDEDFKGNTVDEGENKEDVREETKSKRKRSDSGKDHEKVKRSFVKTEQTEDNNMKPMLPIKSGAFFRFFRFSKS